MSSLKGKNVLVAGGDIGSGNVLSTMCNPTSHSHKVGISGIGMYALNLYLY